MRGLAVAVLAIAFAMLAGCASRPASYEPPVTVPDAFSPGPVSITLAIADRWWTTLGDARLDTLQAIALRDNLMLQTAWERLREARAAARIAGAPRYPALDAFAEGEVRRPSASEDGTLDLGLAASYEIDLWGRIGARSAAEQFRARATLADYRATALSLAAEVALAWYRLVEARAAHDLVERQIDTNARSLELLRARFGTGLVRRADILRQQRLLESTREQALAIEARAGVLRHQLALLLGQAPTAASAASALDDTLVARLPDLPPPPPTGLPADLVQRRPDVLAAYLRLQAADRDLAAAVSDRYPRLTLTASLSTTADGSSALFDDWLRSLAGGLLAPIFRGGELSGEVDRNEARRQQRLLEYGQTVLVAFAEVEDALVRERTRRERIASLEVQVQYAEETSQRLRLEYFNGVVDFLDVLTAQVDQQRLERDLLAARLALVEDRIALYRALAGGFTTARETTNGS
jgi:NodT family efflux transporter outer membrane factor (OMF) lipoprotein